MFCTDVARDNFNMHPMDIRVGAGGIETTRYEYALDLAYF